MVHPLSIYREKHGLTLKRLADRLGVDKSTLFRWELGEIQLSAERILQIERQTGIKRERLRPDLYDRARA
jgi:transcriptional regulator with XRE-family HTH domain